MSFSNRTKEKIREETREWYKKEFNPIHSVFHDKALTIKLLKNFVKHHPLLSLNNRECTLFYKHVVSLNLTTKDPFLSELKNNLEKVLGASAIVRLQLAHAMIREDNLPEADRLLATFRNANEIPINSLLYRQLHEAKAAYYVKSAEYFKKKDEEKKVKEELIKAETEYKLLEEYYCNYAKGDIARTILQNRISLATNLNHQGLFFESLKVSQQLLSSTNINNLTSRQLAEVHHVLSITYKCIEPSDVTTPKQNLKNSRQHNELSVKADPQYAPALSMRGKIFRELGNESEAQRYFEKARQCNRSRWNRLHGPSDQFQPLDMEPSMSPVKQLESKENADQPILKEKHTRKRHRHRKKHSVMQPENTDAHTVEDQPQVQTEETIPEEQLAQPQRTAWSRKQTRNREHFYRRTTTVADVSVEAKATPLTTPAVVLVSVTPTVEQVVPPILRKVNCCERVSDYCSTFFKKLFKNHNSAVANATNTIRPVRK